MKDDEAREGMKGHREHRAGGTEAQMAEGRDGERSATTLPLRWGGGVGGRRWG